MYKIIKSQDIDCSENNWTTMEFSDSVSNIIFTWALLVESLKVQYPDCLIQPCEDGHSPFEVCVGYSRRTITLSAEAYISGKVAYKLITEE